MEHSRVTLPEPDYLARIGEVAYTVASIEWAILGDLVAFGMSRASGAGIRASTSC